ncbi:uncharacterized [Tachysurus ichikawai]
MKFIEEEEEEERYDDLRKKRLQDKASQPGEEGGGRQSIRIYVLLAARDQGVARQVYELASSGSTPCIKSGLQ